MNGAALVIVNRDLERWHPELSHHERGLLAAEFVDKGWAWLAANGEARVTYCDEVRSRAPRMPFSSDTTEDAKIRRSLRLPPAAPPTPAVVPRASQPPKRTVEELRAERDAVRGDDDGSKLRRAALSEQIAKHALVPPIAPHITNDLQADLKAVSGRSLDDERIKRSNILEAHIRARLGDAYSPTRENP
jgi:hypothetical protein